ncbi:MAG TPA: MbnP family protein [Bacteroidia bacterium]|jgi:hypothetical protein|nr:MbnP family protein [Bacteroidia bacterium]
MFRKVFHILVSIAVLVAAMSFIAKPHSTFTIHFNNYVGNEILELDSTTYKNALGQTYTVSKFKYYIGNISLKNKNGKEFNSSEYFLVNEEDPPSKQITLANVPDGDYTSISFMLGVDSMHNCSGAQEGALDPINAMFWAWNTGYIFLKMEGKSSLSKSPGNLLEFHIGGYKAPYNCIRTITLTLSKNTIVGDKSASINIKTDLSELFKTPTIIDFSKLSSVTDFHNATTIANNYSDMFSIH